MVTSHWPLPLCRRVKERFPPSGFLRSEHRLLQELQPQEDPRGPGVLRAAAPKRLPARLPVSTPSPRQSQSEASPTGAPPGGHWDLCTVGISIEVVKTLFSCVRFQGYQQEGPLVREAGRRVAQREDGHGETGSGFIGGDATSHTLSVFVIKHEWTLFPDRLIQSDPRC